MSEANKRRWRDPDYAARVSAGVKEATSTPEARARMSQQSSEQWRDRDYTLRMVAIQQRLACDPQWLQKKSIGQRRAWRRNRDAYHVMLQFLGRQHLDALLVDCKNGPARYAEAYRIINSITPEQWVALAEDYQPPTAEE